MSSSIDLPRELNEAFASNTLVKLVLARGVEEGAKVSARPVVVKGETRLQWAERRGKQEVHANLTLGESLNRLKRDFPTRFRQVNLLTTEADFESRADARGKVVSRRGKPSTKRPVDFSHDAAKHYLIPEGKPCAFLEAVGVMTADGRVRAAMQHKFRQINRFLEFVNDIYGDLPAEGVIRVVDFGCGKSYLTLAIHHLLTVVHNRQVDITGIDRTPEVVETCRSVAERLELEGLRFEAGDIGDAKVEDQVHLAVALHACDTATDGALAKAVQWKSNVILAAPCCQHEIAAQMHAEPLELLEAHGILKERFAALATDAMRAAALEAAGYRTQVIEFIDLDHTAKNLLIRGVRRDQVDPETQARWSAKLRAMEDLLQIRQTAIDSVGGSGNPR
jgi:SAM-dependent methyltransferase